MINLVVDVHTLCVVVFCSARSMVLVLLYSYSYSSVDLVRTVTEAGYRLVPKDVYV